MCDINSHETASSSAECSRDKPPFSFVREQDLTMWDIVWVSPQGHRSVSVSRHFHLQAPQCPCSVRKRFSRDHCCRGRSKPGLLAESARLILCQFLFMFFLFCSRCCQDHQADLHQIFWEDDKWGAMKKKSFWFLHSLGGGREVQIGHFCFRHNFTKFSMAAKRMSFQKNESCLILSG